MSKLGSFWKSVLAGGAGVAALAALNAAIRHQASEPDVTALIGQPDFFSWKYGKVFFKTAGPKSSRPPLLFVHGIGPGSSSFMWRKNFNVLAEDFNVFALDLLGFGFSEKPGSAPYSADLYVELVTDFIREVCGYPANVIASSLGAAYAVRVADEHSELVNSLVLNAPGGGQSFRSRPGMANAAFYGLLQSPVLGTSFHNVMASERSIRDYARRHLFYDHRRVTDRLVAHLYATSHQPGAQHAIAAFLAGYLNTDMRGAFARLSKPTVLIWGKQDLTTPLESALALSQSNASVRVEVFDYCRMLPEQEHPERFNDLVRESFLAARSASG